MDTTPFEPSYSLAISIKQAFIAVGGVRGSMPWEEFAKMRLPVPSLEKQHQVVRAHQIIADRIEIKRRINDNLAA